MDMILLINDKTTEALDFYFPLPRSQRFCVPLFKLCECDVYKSLTALCETEKCP